jgi:hypothetical protein
LIPLGERDYQVIQQRHIFIIKLTTNPAYSDAISLERDDLASKEDRIRELEGQLSNLRMTAGYGNSCEMIARIELQLSQLYAQTGNKAVSDQMIDEAQKTLQDPLCPRTRNTDSMLRNIEYYKSHPGVLSAQSMPAIYRYLSLIILLIGYLGLYLVYYLDHAQFPYNDFLIGILIVFVLSIGINFAVRSRFVKRSSRQ